jgi:hypothetical protein
MPISKIPLLSTVNSNPYGPEARESNLRHFNLFSDDLGGLIRRPGVATLASSEEDADCSGVFYWPEKDVIVAVLGDQKVMVFYRGSVSLIGQLDLTGASGQPPTFARCQHEGADLLVLANGGRLHYLEQTGTSYELKVIDGAAAPQRATHVCYIGRYLVANDTQDALFRWSGTGRPLEWASNNAGDQEPEDDPDRLVALDAAYGRLIIFGSRTAETYVPDGSEYVFSRQSSIPLGCLAPHSICRADGGWFFLDHHRRVVQSSGSSSQVISSSIQRQLDGLEYVEDARSFFMEIGGHPFLMINFPEEERCFVYHLRQAQWSEWGEWSSEEGSYLAFPAQCYCYADSWKMHIMGSRKSGKLLELSPEHHDDDGKAIRAEVLTAYLDHGTLARKRSDLLRFRCRGGGGSEKASLWISWRNDDEQEFSTPRKVELGGVGETNFVKSLRKNGSYRARQYRIFTTARSGVVLLDAEEMVEVMGR